jgi:DNA-binding transcriptional ArsR family regulator/uncharacterized protein YndB with AHSA1/START domain
MSQVIEVAISDDTSPDLWRALASPLRRRMLDLLAERPHTTSELADAEPELSRFAVMQHLDVLTKAGLVLVRRRGRHRFNHLNPVPLRRWYERWIEPLADLAATEVLSLERHFETRGEKTMTMVREEVRTVRIETELRFKTTPERLFRALTDETLEWFPHSYGQERTKAVVMEPWVGGRQYEDWGDGAGHLYGHVTAYDPPRSFSTRGRIMAGTILDSEYRLTAEDEVTVLNMSKVAVGPMTEEEAGSIEKFGDLAHFEDALRAQVEDR